MKNCILGGGGFGGRAGVVLGGGGGGVGGGILGGGWGGVGTLISRLSEQGTRGVCKNNRFV